MNLKLWQAIVTNREVDNYSVAVNLDRLVS